MAGVEKQLRSAVKKLLDEKKVSVVIGWQKGSFGAVRRPLFLRSGDDVKKLVFDPLCASNLVRYLDSVDPLERVGIVVKGCDSRAVVQLMQERGVKRDRLVVIGVSCGGVVESDCLHGIFGSDHGFEFKDVSKDSVVVLVDGKERKVKRSEVLCERCSCCEFPNPVVADVMIGEKVEACDASYEEVVAFEKKSSKERWGFWEREFEKCLRCYACRNACPLCYCPECMAESLDPQWLMRSVNASESGAWNIMRAMHLAGRCIGCGECERACPVGIPLMLLNKKLEKEVKKRFGHVAGIDPDGKPALTLFDPNDPEEFVI